VFEYSRCIPIARVRRMSWCGDQ